jgi:hypothetical protein
MKNLSTLFLLFIVLTSCGHIETRSEESNLTINLDSVNQIYISGYCGVLDTCEKSVYRPYLLNETMKENIIEKLNKSISKDPCNFEEYSTEYRLNVYFNNETSRGFKMFGGLIKEGDNQCFEINDADYFENLWVELDDKWNELNTE